MFKYVQVDIVQKCQYDLSKMLRKGDGHIGILKYWFPRLSDPTSFLMMKSVGNSSNSSLCSQLPLLSKCEGERVLLSNCNAEEPKKTTQDSPTVKKRVLISLDGTDVLARKEPKPPTTWSRCFHHEW